MKVGGRIYLTRYLKGAKTHTDVPPGTVVSLRAVTHGSWLAPEAAEEGCRRLTKDFLSFEGYYCFIMIYNRL